MYTCVSICLRWRGKSILSVIIHTSYSCLGSSSQVIHTQGHKNVCLGDRMVEVKVMVDDREVDSKEMTHVVFY